LGRRLLGLAAAQSQLFALFFLFVFIFERVNGALLVGKK
jgi:hypothetical protein